MLLNSYRLEIQFKKVRKVRKVNNISMDCPDHWNVGLRRTDFKSLQRNGLFITPEKEVEALCQPHPRPSLRGSLADKITVKLRGGSSGGGRDCINSLYTTTVIV